MARVSRCAYVLVALLYGDLYIHKSQITPRGGAPGQQTKTLKVASRRHHASACLDASVVGRLRICKPATLEPATLTMFGEGKGSRVASFGPLFGEVKKL